MLKVNSYPGLRSQIEQSGAAARAVELRHKIHCHPELGEHEFDTAKLIASELEALGIEHKFIADTGVVGVLYGTGRSAGNPGPVIGIRADIDALPIQEDHPELDFASKVPGMMHACGHDTHTAILLGTAHLLNSMRDAIPGTVKFFFQPAEETVGGAERMIAAGCLENPEVNHVIGLHVSPDFPSGTAIFRYGKMYAACDSFDIEVHGRASHAAHPDKGVDAILTAAMILTNLQSIVSRNIEATNSAVVSFGTIEGGRVCNQVADYVKICGTVRTLDPVTRRHVCDRVKTIAESTASMMGGSATVTLTTGYDPMINDDAIVEIVKSTATELLGAENIKLDEVPSLGGEDFAYFAKARPSCFFRLGCAVPGDNPETSKNLIHSPQFFVDESCIEIGILLEAASVLKLMA